MKLEKILEQLTFESLQAALPTLCEQAAKHEWSYREFLEHALSTEQNQRMQQGIQNRLKRGRFPWIKTLADFDMSFQPSIDKKVMRDLSGLSFVDRAENVILLGPPGVGKTHIAIGLGVKAAEAGHKVLFMPLDKLLTSLIKARQSNRLSQQLALYTSPALLILDEIGYLPMTREEADLFFRLINKRYESSSIILTSNKSFVDWGEFFGDEVLATAILDRLLHHSVTLNIKGKSYRLKNKHKAGTLVS